MWLSKTCRHSVEKNFTQSLWQMPWESHDAAGATPSAPACSFPPSLPSFFRPNPSTRRTVVAVGVWASLLWQHCRIRLSHLVIGGQAEPAGVTQRLLQGSDTVQSSVIFGRRITLCHEMDLLILLRVWVGGVWVFVCVCVHWYDP